MDALLRPILLLALVLNPLLLACCFLRRLTPALWFASVGPIAVALNLLVPLALHMGGIPVIPSSLAVAHGQLSLALLLARRVIQRHHDVSVPRTPSGLLPLLLLYAVAVLPVTPIAGIDTYKWQDLATNVAVERCIPWLVHPASLFGFTPRAYPSAHPLVLASVEILGQTGVDWGFYLVSLLTGFMAITGAFALGERLFGQGAPVGWLALVYGFSPLLMRYGYWATGRGFVLALLPLFVRALLGLPRPGAGLAALGLGLALALSHKAGLVAAVLVPLAMALAPFLRRLIPRSRTAQFACVAAAALTGLLLTPGPFAWASRAVSRFGWIAPLAVAGWMGALWTETRDRSRCLAGALLTLPLAFTDEPYGALLAGLFLALPAAEGLTRLLDAPGRIVPAARKRMAVALLLLAALVVLTRQAADSPSKAVYRAAQFLETQDPLGPYRLEAPGRVRTQMQAYLSGCPRFTVRLPSEARLSLHAPPPLTGHWRRDIREWTAWFRSWIDLTESDTEWYGANPRVYHVTVDADGVVPTGARLIYNREGVALYQAP